jgi:hypothetical protein
MTCKKWFGEGVWKHGAGYIFLALKDAMEKYELRLTKQNYGQAILAYAYMHNASSHRRL